MLGSRIAVPVYQPPHLLKSLWRCAAAADAAAAAPRQGPVCQRGAPLVPARRPMEDDGRAGGDGLSVELLTAWARARLHVRNVILQLVDHNESERRSGGGGERASAVSSSEVWWSGGARGCVVVSAG